MQVRSRVLAGAMIGAVATLAGAVGTIEDSGATIEAGAGANQGTVTLDDCAPEAAPPQIPFVGVPGAIGSMIGEFPEFPGFGDGSDGAFAAATDVTLPGGTFNFTDYTIDNGVTVTYTGPVEILVESDITINGVLETSEQDSPIRIACAGHLTLEGQPGVSARIQSNASGGGVRIDAGGDFQGRADANVNSTGVGDIEIASHVLEQLVPKDGGKAGNTTQGGHVELLGTRVNASSGHILLQGATSVRAVDGNINTSTGDILVQSFLHGITLDDTGVNISSRSQTLIPDGGIRLEAAEDLTLRNDSSVNTSTGNIGLAAYDGAYLQDDSRLNTSTGDIDIRSRGNLTMDADSRTNTSSGNTEFSSFGGDVAFVPVGRTGSQNFNTSTGNISVRAQGSITANDSPRFNTSTGSHTWRAFTGSISFGGDPEIDLNCGTGVIDMRAFDSIAGGELDLNADGITLSAGNGGIDVLLDDASPFRDGGFFAIATGPVAIAGEVRSDVGDVHIVSCEGTVDVSSAMITTSDQGGAGESSAAILIESFAGATGVIDAEGATIMSGDAENSGDISLLVHEGKIGNQPPPVTIRSFLLPKKISVKPGAGGKGGPSVKVVGFFDEGPGPVDLSQPAEITVGPLVFQTPGLRPEGKFLVFEGEGLVLKVRPSKLGSSKGKFNLTFTGDPGDVDVNGEYTLRYRGGGVDAAGTVRLVNGAFKFGKVPGTLIAPELDIRKAKAKLPGVGNHQFKFVAGVAGDGKTPATAPDVFVGFGDLFNADLPSDSLTLKGKNFKLAGKGPNGIAAVALNYAKERISVRGGDIDLGNVPEGPAPLLLIYRQGEDVRAVLVRAVRKGKSFKY